ncbi:hypothetical protein [Streptomyces sp. A1277]|nr:hypothetical protein [Streptomyces sp. A1277]
MTRTGPNLPPCMYGRACQYDDDAGLCPCEDDADTLEPRLTVNVPTGDYL